MATEQILDGQYFRRLKDAANNVWERLSFWTKAKDVYFEDGKNLENKIGNMSLLTGSLAIDTSKVTYDYYNTSTGKTYIMASHTVFYIPVTRLCYKDMVKKTFDTAKKMIVVPSTHLNNSSSQCSMRLFGNVWPATMSELEAEGIALPSSEYIILCLYFFSDSPGWSTSDGSEGIELNIEIK